MLIFSSACVVIGPCRDAHQIHSSKWMKETQRTFAWQRGYDAFSVSSSNISKVIRYIDQQEAHHKKKSFDEEFIGLLKKHGVEFDPRYVLD
jgi:putative transposase